jgi:hypothetical protein
MTEKRPVNASTTAAGFSGWLAVQRLAFFASTRNEGVEVEFYLDFLVFADTRL